MSAVGSDVNNRPHSRRSAWGFTLLELMVVVTIIAIGSAGVTFALRDGAATSLNREADRLSAMLESARAQSRSSGLALAWVPGPQGYAVRAVPTHLPSEQAAGMQDIMPAQTWLTAGTTAQLEVPSLSAGGTQAPAQMLLLGPEPMIAPQAIVLRLGEQALRIESDGLRPFRVSASAVPAPR